MVAIQISPESSNWDNRVDTQVNSFNDIQGDLKGYDCPKCKNRGGIAKNRNGEFTVSDCECKTIRISMEYIRESGLADLLEIYTFDRYKTEYNWQKFIKERAIEYTCENSGSWLSVLGCVGAGKTHICTAVCGELLKKGHSLKYLLWRDEGVKIKAAVNDGEEYSRLIYPFKSAEILYIDDLFKTKKDTPLSPGDINLAFELINYRYNQPDKKTIISSEKSIGELLDIDEAVGSRIYERCKMNDYCLEIAKTSENNIRLK